MSFDLPLEKSQRGKFDINGILQIFMIIEMPESYLTPLKTSKLKELSGSLT